jgi:glyoxylase-like metal-dependent hydrolase (beta-lactamase superfamily II)
MAAFPDAQLVIHPRGERHMVDPEKLVAGTIEVYGQQRFSELYGEVLPVDPARVSVPGDGEILSLGHRRIACHYTRGHADHHFCLWDEDDRAWFSGDMFGVSYPWLRFPGGPLLLPSTTPTQFRPVEYAASLDLLASREPRQMYLTHTGALEYSRSLVDGLRQQLDHYCELALREGNEAGELTAALGDYALQRARRLGYQGESAELLEWLATDSRLNAQGLAIWAQRSSGAGA